MKKEEDNTTEQQHDAKVLVSESTLNFLCYSLAGLLGYVMMDIAILIFKYFR